MFGQLRGFFGLNGSSFSSQLAPVPTAVLEPDELAAQRPEWSPAVANAQSCLGQVFSAAGNPVGCGFLVGIDRLLVPLHMVENGCPSQFSVQFLADNGRVCFAAEFPFVQFLEGNSSYDYCLVQLGKDAGGQYPGQLCPMPQLRCKHHEGQYLFAQMGADGACRMSIGNPCAGRQSAYRYCAYSQTEAGSSGGGYFDQTGALFALHSGRMKTSCGYSGQERSAVYVHDFLDTSRFANIKRCTPICPPKRTVMCLPKVLPPARCIDYEKGRPSVSGEYQHENYTCKFWELHPSNNRGAGPRGIRMTITEQLAGKASRKKKAQVISVNRADESLWLTPNPHEVTGYNKNANPLYQTAAKTYFTRYLDKKVGGPFAFNCYGQKFIAK